MSVAKARCHVIRTIAESQDQIEEFWMVEFGEAYGILQHVSEARRRGHTVSHLLKPIVSKRYLLKRMTLEEREIQVLQQLV
jgi:hypothetical protein